MSDAHGGWLSSQREEEEVGKAAARRVRVQDGRGERRVSVRETNKAR
jgi:hypothetical protein